MTAKAATAEETIRQVVRGERPWTDLCPLGMAAQPEEGRCQFLSSFPSDVRVSVHDLAHGFLAHLADLRGLKEWAFVMEALPAEFEAEAHPAGKVLLDAVWGASFGESPDADELRVIEELARGEQGE